MNPTLEASAAEARPESVETALIKVPAITLVFWIIKIAATTLGETAGDALSMSAELGYLLSTAIFGVIFAVSVVAQIRARAFRPWLYWATIVTTTTVGTTLADFATRSLGIGYLGGSLMLAACLCLSLVIWHRMLGSISVTSIRTTRSEVLYWITIMFSQTLGTALGDWTADSAGLGFGGGSILFGVLLLMVCGAYYWTAIPHTLLFWLAFVLTRPLGAVLGDLLDKPHAAGGLALSRPAISALLLIFMACCIALFPQRAAQQAH